MGEPGSGGGGGELPTRLDCTCGIATLHASPPVREPCSPSCRWLLLVAGVAGLFASGLFAAGKPMSPKSDWGRVAVERNAHHQLEALLENRWIRVRYQVYQPTSQKSEETVIREFLIKSTGQNVAKSKIGLDAAAWRGTLKQAVVVRDDAERKTIRLVWQSLDEKPDPEEEVSIFPTGPFVEIRYLRWNVNIVDRTTGGAHFAVYGADHWVRGYVPYPLHYYNRVEHHIENIKAPDVADGGPLNYDGSFILGVYDRPSGAGWAEVMPVSAVSIVKLLDHGFEIFPRFKQPHRAFSSFLFGVTGGPQEIERRGKELADRLHRETSAAASSPATKVR